MRKYNICIAVFITLLLSACGNMAELTGETDSSFDVSESAWQEQIEPTQELVEKTEDTITEEDMHLLRCLPQAGWSGEHPDLERVPV